MLKGYFARSRAPRYSLLFALPLLLLYEGFSAALSGSAVAGVRNGADVLLKSLFVGLGGRDGLVLFGVLLALTGALLVWRDQRKAKEPLEAGVFGLMLAESALYATGFGFVVGYVTSVILGAPGRLAVGTSAGLDLQSQLVVSLGAGIYEELVFRVLLVSVLMWGARSLLGTGKTLSAVIAVVTSALLFSSFHYVGSLGDTFTVQSFVFRVVAGLAFSALYVTRGLGITAWTHALYDLGFSLLTAGSRG